MSDINTPLAERDYTTELLRDKLEDLYKDVDLNYRRQKYNNPAIRMIMAYIGSNLKDMANLLDFPDATSCIHEKEGTKKPVSFGITNKDLK